MHKRLHYLFHNFIRILTIISALPLMFVIVFIIKEALPLFREVSLGEFLFGNRWMPIDYTGSVSYGIAYFIIATLFVSLLAIVFALIIGIGASIFLSCVASERARNAIYPVIDLLAGIPSVIYGFIGLLVLVPWFRKIGVHVGTCVLAGAILLSVMLLPFLISSCSDTMVKIKNDNLAASDALGIDSWYAVATIVLPASLKQILLICILAVGRAMGETMAVMMVVGNANLFPHLFGKGETIASLIALEMGTAVVGSNHYHALYAAGLVLLILVCIINFSITFASKKIAAEERHEAR